MEDAKILAAIDAPFECFDFDDPITFRQWCATVLTKLYDVDESFGGKRPFGNSGWSYYLAKPFVAARIIEGDEDGYPVNNDDAAKIVFRAIELVVGSTPLDYR